MFKFKRQWQKRIWKHRDFRSYNKFCWFPTKLTRRIVKGGQQWADVVWLKWVTVREQLYVSNKHHFRCPNTWWSIVSVVLKKKD
jgi:hypothetical protein